MKIACIATSTIPSRTANSIQVMKACHALAQEGADVCLWTPGNTSLSFSEFADLYGLQTEFSVRWLPTSRQLRKYDFIWRAYQAARKWGMDVLYTWIVQDALLAVRDAIPTVYELHGPPTGRLAPLLTRWLVKTKSQKRFVFITLALKKQVEKQLHLRIPSGESILAPNGVETERYADLPDPVKARAHLGLPQGLTAGYTGHLYAGRGMNLLLELARRLPSLNFLWVGGNPEDVNHWKTMFSNAGITNTYLTGFVDQKSLPLYQAACDILLMPYERKIAGSSGGDSTDYCSPMKMFDYMASGRAIVSSDLPVIHEILNHSNAILCAPEDPEDWEKALISLLSDPTRRDQLAQQAQADAQKYSWRQRERSILDSLLQQ
ncbi:MAG TPA: glycosyltransferase [Anaerolineaceae bacterium]